MTANQELEGRRYELPEPYLVGREHIRSFARAVLATNPVHTELDAARAAGYPDLVAPPTFTAVIQDIGLQMFLADSGIELSSIVHGDESFSYGRPIIAGDELHAELRITGIRSLGAGSMIKTETIITDAHGERVVTASATLVAGAGEAA